jgi:hypothetical protein
MTEDINETIQQLQQLQAMYLERGSSLEANRIGVQIQMLLQKQGQMNESSKILLG